MCTPDSGGSGADFIYIPPPDPAAEKLRRDVETYDRAMGSIFEGTGSIEPFLGLPWPADEAELSRRSDSVLATIWTEFRTNALEAELLIRQAAFYNERNELLRTQVADKQDLLARMGRFLPERRQLLVRNEEVLAEARQLEAEMTALALRILNDRTSERAALATLLVFAPEPQVQASSLAPVAPITSVAGLQSVPEPPLAEVSMVPAEPEPSPPREYAQFIVSQPAAEAPLAEKLAMLQRAGSALAQDTLTVRDLGRSVPQSRAEYEALLAERERLDRDSQPLKDETSGVDFGIERAMAEIHVSVDNQLLARTSLVTDVVVDMALDRAVGEMRAAIDEVAGSEGLSARIPASRSQALLDLARRGGRIALPLASHARAWEAFVEAQEKTLDVLTRAQGFMTEAAEVAARGSPEEIEAVLERVFASVRWQTFDLVRNTSYSVLPEGEDGTAIEEAFNRYADKLRERQTGE